MAILGFLAFMLSIRSLGKSEDVPAWRGYLGRTSGIVWCLRLLGVFLLLAKLPFFDGYYHASLPNPTFGKG
jgi:hypothetical protein